MKKEQMKSIGSRLISGLLFLMLFLAFAAPSSAQVVSKFSLVNDSFISSAFEASEKSSYQFFTGQLKTDPKTAENFYIDLSAGYAFGAPLLSYINATELYVSPQLVEKSKVIFGRKLLDWSELDRRWTLGIFEPTFLWNPLSPKPQGLTGIFWSFDEQFYGAHLFLSSLYLPDQGPSFEIVNGRFEKGNPWFRRPPEFINLNGVYTSIDYTIRTPEMSEVIFRQSFAGNLRVGEKNGLRGVFSLASMPSNQVAKTYKGVINTQELRGEVEVIPVIYEHILASGDFVYEIENVEGGVSVIYDNPSQPTYSDGFTHPKFSAATLVSPFVELRFRGSRSSVWKLGLQALAISGSGVEDIGPDASEDRGSLTSRYPFSQAVELYGAMSLRFSKRQRILSKISYMQSDENKFSVIKWNNLWSLDSHWDLITDLVLVEAADVTRDNQNDISQFKNHDRLIIGASYAF